MTPLLRILRLWRGQAAWLGLGLLVSLASTGTGVALLQRSGVSVAVALATGVLATTAILPWLGGARVVLRYGERLLTHSATFRALAELRIWFFRGLAARAAGGLGFRRAGDVLSRLVNDIQALDGLYLRILVPATAALLLLAALLVLIGRHSIGIGLIVVVLLGEAALALPWIAARRTEFVGLRLAEAMAALRVAALDALGGLREVHAFGAQGRMLALIQSRQGVLLQAQHALVRQTSRIGAGTFLLGQAAILAVLLTASFDPVAAVMEVFLTVAAFEVIAVLPRAGVLAGHTAAAAARVLEAAEDAPVQPDPVQPATMPAGSALRFDGVTFRWQPERPSVFEGLTLDVPASGRVAILGPSGVGKSTLAALALRTATPEQGRVLLGGVDIAKLRASDLRTRIGWLSQATHLFDCTIRENLELARPGATDPELWAALEQARLADMVHALPDGLESWMGEGGARMSGGEGRRLALARALLSPAAVLILDEPCSGLDAETERAFFSVLNEVAGDRSIVLIAHRLTGVERLDRIYRLSRGHAVAAAA